MARILHLTHTNITYDNRILKQIGVLARGEGNTVRGIGVYADEGAADSMQSMDAEIVTVRLFSKKLLFLPKVLRYPLVLVELLVQLIARGARFTPDVIQCHDTMVLPAGVIIKIICGATLIYDAHELESNKNGSPILVSKAILWIEKICWPKIDVLISVSQSIVDWYNDNLGRKQSVVILNSPHLESEESSLGSEAGAGRKAYFRGKYGIPDDSLVFIYVGLFGAGRGIEKLITAFSSPGVKSHLVFLGYGEMKGYIAEHTERVRNIHCHDAVPHEQVVRLVRHADVGLCLIEAVSMSDYYCLPNKLFEYCFAGVPVLASRFPELEKIIGEYQLGCCTELDDHSIAVAIRRMEVSTVPLITSDLYPLSWAAQEEKLLEMYAGIIRSVPSRR